MSDEIPSLEKLIKLMRMTTSSNDGEALSAIRLANRMIDSWKGDWEKILSGKITVIGDPFANVSVKAPSRNAPPPPKPTRPAPQQPIQTRWSGASGSVSGSARSGSTYSPPPLRPAFNPSAPQPAQPSPSWPQMSFTKTATGHWRVKSNVKLHLNDHYEIPTRNSGLRRVKITGADGTDAYGNYLYMSVNAPLNVGDFL